MGNREDLLAGARRCLYEKGYARTTARDIATTSGVSLAAIGYHFGSKEALLNAALMQAVEEWGEELERALATTDDAPVEPLARFEATWTRVIETFATHRPLWIATFEIFAQIEHVPQVREQLAAAIQEARRDLAALFRSIDSTGDERQVLAVGSFIHALLTGVLAQWLVDPEHAPTGRDLTDALRMTAAGIGAGDEITARDRLNPGSSADRSTVTSSSAETAKP